MAYHATTGPRAPRTIAAPQPLGEVVGSVWEAAQLVAVLVGHQ